MKNKTATSINIVTLLMCFFIGITTAFFGIVGGGTLVETILEIIVMAIGAYVTAQLHVILHELGHLLGGHMGGYKLYSFRIGFIKFVRINDKVKMRFEKLGNNYAGVCQMFPTSTDNIEISFAKFVKGGIYTSLFLTILALAFVLTPFFFTINRYVYLFFVMSLPVSFYLYTINASTKIATQGMTDGMYLKALKENLPDGIVIVKLMAVQGLLQSGVRPKDIGEELFFDYPMLAEDNQNRCSVLTNMFSYALDVQDYKLAVDIAEDIEHSIVFAPDLYFNQIMIDVFFSECLIKKDLARAKDIYDEIIVDLEKEIDLPVLVMKIAYESRISKNNDIVAELMKVFEIYKSIYCFQGIVYLLEDLTELILNNPEIEYK